MRLRPGRPKLDRYRALRNVPTADGELAATFLGVSTLVFADRDSAIVTDGFFTRPNVATLALRRLESDEARIDYALQRAGITKLDGVAVVHSHYDHALDSVAVARRTQAPLIGGRSLENVGRGGGLDDSEMRIVTSGQRIMCGHFALTFIASSHSPPDRSPGEISEPLRQPVRWSAYKGGEMWSIVVEHTRSGRTALVEGSAGPGVRAFGDLRAEVAYLGIGQLGLLGESYVSSYWEQTVRAVHARRVVLIHWDDFTRPLTKRLLPIPYSFDDIHATMATLMRLAQEDKVSLHFPHLWEREDPWQGL